MYQQDEHGIRDDKMDLYCVALTIEATERICKLLNRDEEEKAIARKKMGMEHDNDSRD